MPSWLSGSQQQSPKRLSPLSLKNLRLNQEVPAPRLTPLSSRKRNESFDKQIVRNWLAANWDQNSKTDPPRLPAEIVTQTLARYAELVERLTGLSRLN
jgi:phosphoribosylaminoimidazole-succinocarboxamide synthase